MSTSLAIPYRPGPPRTPKIVATFTGPTGSRRNLNLIVDAGSNRTHVNREIATQLGIVIPDDEVSAGTINSAAGSIGEYWLRELDVRITDGEGSWEWRTEVAVSNTHATTPVIGWAGFLVHFKLTFDPEGREPGWRILFAPQSWMLKNGVFSS